MEGRTQRTGTVITIRDEGEPESWLKEKDSMAFPLKGTLCITIERHGERLTIDVETDGTFQVLNETMYAHSVLPRGRMRGKLGEGDE